MGLWNFYINLKIDNYHANSLMQAYNHNLVYQNAFHYGVVSDWVEGGYNAGISSVIDSFLPANILIYDFITINFDESTNFYIKALDVERAFDFKNKTDFIDFMYNVWWKKIDDYYKLMGGILINPRKYDPVRSRLYEKYYKKIQ